MYDKLKKNSKNMRGGNKKEEKSRKKELKQENVLIIKMKVV